MTNDELFQTALALPYEAREELTRQLIDSLVPGEYCPPEEWEASWAEEIERRIELVESGQMETLSHDEFMERTRKLREEMHHQRDAQEQP